MKIIPFEIKLKFFNVCYTVYLKLFCWYIKRTTSCLAINLQWDIFFILPDKYKNKAMSEDIEFSNDIKNDILFLVKKSPRTSDFYHIKYLTLQNPLIKNQIISYFLVYDYLYTKVFKFSKKDDDYKKAKLYDENVERISDFSQIKKITNEAFKRKKVLKNEQKLYAKILYTKNRNKEFGKIKFTFSFFTKAITLISALLLVSGFLYNYFLFKNFGVLISNFFTATDYIESSIDVTIPILLSTLYSGIITLLGYLNSIDKKMEKFEFKIEHNNNMSPMIIISFIIMLLAIIAITYFLTNNIIYPALELLSLVVGYVLWAKFYNDERFESPQKIYIAGMVFIFLSVTLVFKTINDINAIKKGEFNKKYTFTFTDYNETENLNYIKSTSNYSFFYDSHAKQTIIIPNSSIEKIEVLDIKNPLLKD